MQTNRGRAVINRRHRRLNRNFMVELSPLTFSPAGAQGVETVCYDISEGGLSVESPKEFPAGDKLQARINIPMLNRFSPGFFKVYENDADQYFLAIVEVLWTRRSGGKILIGMHYVNVDEDQARALAGLINKAFQTEKKPG